MKQKAIIIDLDGTLCNIEHRRKWIDGTMGKKDWDKFYEGIPDDEINEWCFAIIDDFVRCTYEKIIFVTGRPEKYRKATCDWLNSHSRIFLGRHVFMRQDGDFRQDAIVKEEIYRKSIEPHYDVLFCIEDRKQVVDMWRKIGLVCLQCDEGDF